MIAHPASLPQVFQNLSAEDLFRLKPQERQNLALWLKAKDWEKLWQLAETLTQSY
ncbi:MAG: hypothetical protein VKK80_03290 [Prochlorothrix sp.]|nr:hypothetical protein [Prochlorothrix sp.]